MWLSSLPMAYCGWKCSWFPCECFSDKHQRLLDVAEYGWIWFDDNIIYIIIYIHIELWCCFRQLGYCYLGGAIMSFDQKYVQFVGGFNMVEFQLNFRRWSAMRSFMLVPHSKASSEPWSKTGRFFIRPLHGCCRHCGTYPSIYGEVNAEKDDEPWDSWVFPKFSDKPAWSKDMSIFGWIGSIPRIPWPLSFNLSFNRLRIHV